jgi:hypothetical protein
VIPHPPLLSKCLVPLSAVPRSNADHEIWKALWRWACRRHPHKPVRWVRKRYFLTLGNRNWVFGAKVKDDRGGLVVKKLLKAKDTPIRKPPHIKIKGDANPFDPSWEAYFAKRLSFDINAKWAIGGGRVNLRKFHRKCHRQFSAKIIRWLPVSARRLCRGLSRMRGNSHVRFLGGSDAAMRCSYPTRGR